MGRGIRDLLIRRRNRRRYGFALHKVTTIESAEARIRSAGNGQAVDHG
jgi:hypothetical protein